MNTTIRFLQKDRLRAKACRCERLKLLLRGLFLKGHA